MTDSLTARMPCCRLLGFDIDRVESFCCWIKLFNLFLMTWTICASLMVEYKEGQANAGWPWDNAMVKEKGYSRRIWQARHERRVVAIFLYGNAIEN